MAKITSKYSRWSWKLSLCILVYLLPSYSSGIRSLEKRQIHYSTSPNQNTTSTGVHEYHLREPQSCWEAFNSAYQSDTPISNQTLSCNNCCETFKVIARLQDWLRITSCPHNTTSCLMMEPDLREKVTQNIFWLTATGDDILVYLGNSSEVILTWDYLDRGQKALEVILFYTALGALIVTLFGNGMVLATTMASPIKREILWMPRINLAITDLLKGIFIMTYAIHNTKNVMKSDLSILSSNDTVEPDWFPGYMYTPLYLTNGYSTFCSLIFGITSVMSLQCQGWLALERVLLCTYQRIHRILSRRNVTLAHIIMWIIGITFPLIVLFGGKDFKGDVFFDPVTRFPLLLPTGTGADASHVFHMLLLIYAVCLFLITTIVSILSIKMFDAKSKKEIAETILYTPTSQIEQQKKIDRHILITMKIMTVLYLISVVPQFFLVLPGLKRNARFIYYLFWWLFVLSSAWNWYIFNLRSEYFKDSLARQLLRIPRLPDTVRTKFEASLLPKSAHVNMQWGSLWCELEDEIEKKRQQSTSGDVV